jgi:hypothetical protein
MSSQPLTLSALTHLGLTDADLRGAVVMVALHRCGEPAEYAKLGVSFRTIIRRGDKQPAELVLHVEVER